jgi:hypothetical protein
MSPKLILRALEVRIGLSGEPRQLRDVLELEFLSRGHSAASAAEQVDRVSAKVAAELLRHQAAKVEAGEIAILGLRDTAGQIVHGSSYIFGDDPDDVRSSKLNRTFAEQIRAHIVSLSYSQFEQFGRAVLKEIGCPDPKVTQHAGDQGIDFYGDISVGSIAGINVNMMKLMHEAKFIIVGQAKHYPDSNIGPGLVRELVGTLVLARTRTFSKEGIDLLSEVVLRPFSPALAIMFTTGGFTKGARHLAQQAGLITFSGWQLAVFLADRGVGLVDAAGGKAFASDRFEHWLVN